MNKLVGIGLLAASFAAGVYVGDTKQPSKELQRHKYAHMSAENGFPQHFLSYRDSLRVNENNRVELYFGSDSTNVWRKVNDDGTVGTLGSKIDESWNRWKQDLKSYFGKD
jgi:general stress protein 26